MATADSPLWTVTGQRQDYGMAANGSFVRGVFVAFTTRSGASGEVFIPADHYTVDNARTAINERATAMETVHNLKG